MGERLHRTQILLEPEPHRELSDIAKRGGRSISKFVREIVQGELDQRKAAQDADIKRRLQGLEKIRAHREKILQERGGEYIDFDSVVAINKGREEQDERNFALFTDPGS